MWNRNEGDILEEIIEAAVKTDIDCLWIADDDSSDNSWEIIKAAKERHPKVEFTRRGRIPGDQGQRQTMLDEVRRRYKPENTWIQVIESDIMIRDTSVREAINKYAIEDLAVSWHLINCSRADWTGVDKYPLWEESIEDLMPLGSYMEHMLYTFRPLPGIKYSKNWRPWPNGFTKYTHSPLKVRHMTPDAPLLAHYGYRGPTHFYLKYQGMGPYHKKYRDWKLDSVESVAATVPWFNGSYACRVTPANRDGWLEYISGVYSLRNKRNAMKLIPNLNTFADLIDRLIVEVNKLAYFENKKREEQGKKKPNSNKVAHWDNLSRDCCEYRSLLKNKINELLSEVCESGEYETLKELRTFRPGGKTMEDILAEKCKLAPNVVRQLVNEKIDAGK
jgi:glycosyltransferase involved in cell wall biosynthesis